MHTLLHFDISHISGFIHKSSSQAEKKCIFKNVFAVFLMEVNKRRDDHALLGLCQFKTKQRYLIKALRVNTLAEVPSLLKIIKRATFMSERGASM